MIHVERHGPIVAIRMARSLFGRPLYWSAAYWVDGLLIDTGPYCAADELAGVLDQLPVQTIVLTHGHEDHIGGLARMQQRFPHAKIYASRLAIPILSDPSRLKMQAYRRIIWGCPPAVEQISPLDEVGNQIRTSDYSFRVVETPGHTRDHISLFEPTYRWLFSGDAYSGGRERQWTKEADMVGVIGSLHTLASLRPERLFPGSGNVRRTPQPELLEKIQQLLQLNEDVAQLAEDGFSVAETVARLLGGEPHWSWLTSGHYSGANLVEACRTYHELTTPSQKAPPQVTRRRPNRTKTKDSSDSY